MVKKVFIGMAAMVGMLLATSCSNDDELAIAQSGDGEAQVTFSLGLEGGIGTRAISDGTGADMLVYAVFDAEGNRVSSIEKTTMDNVTFPTTATLTLAKGQTYKVAFWAQNSACTAYTLDDNMTVSVSYDDADNNDETRDAFFKTVEFTVTESTSISVELKRPFAQINVGVTDADWTDAVASGSEISKSKVVIKNAATSLDLVTGRVSNPVEVTYGLAEIPDETLTVDADGDGTAEAYHWLSMSYILVDDESETGDQKAVLEGLEFTFNSESGNGIVLKDGLTSVPVQRNWRTNILGKLLTGDITFKISIDPIYDDDNLVLFGGETELRLAAKNGGVVTLTEDVDLSTMLIIDGNAVINLNGHSITPKYAANYLYRAYGTIYVNPGAELVINGDGIVGSLESKCCAVFANDNTKVTINGGTYYGGDGSSCIYMTLPSVRIPGSIEIYGGYFAVAGPANYGKEWYYVLNLNNGSIGTITVYGGEFENYDPASGDDNIQPTNFVADGYKSILKSTNPDVYEVVKDE